MAWRTLKRISAVVLAGLAIYCGGFLDAEGAELAAQIDIDVKAIAEFLAGIFG